MALVECKVCSSLVEDFTTSSYRLNGGGPVIGRICVDCGQTPTAEEQADYEQYQEDYAQLGLVRNEDGTLQIDDSLLIDYEMTEE